MSQEMQLVEAPAPVRTAETVALEIRTLQRQAQGMVLGYAIEIGRRLVEAKELVPYGTWGDYLREQVHYSQSTANNMMKIFREYGAEQQSLFGGEAESQALGNLSYTKALALLALPSDEREEFVQENNVEAMSSRELSEAIKAKAEAEARAKAAEEARDNISEQMKVANASLEGAQSRVEEARRAQREAEEEAERLRAELTAQEEKGAEPDRPDETILTAIAQARAQGKKDAEKKLERQRAEAEKLKKKLAEAEERAGAAREEAEAALAQANEARAEAEKARKEKAALGEKELAEFSVRFKQVQLDFSELLDCLGRVSEERRGKLRTALETVLDNMKGRVAEGKKEEAEAALEKEKGANHKKV